MERLTRKSNVGEALPVKHLNLRHEDTTSEDTLNEIIEKLSEYEELGVTPQQIKEISHEYQKKCEEVDRLENELQYSVKLPCKVGDKIYKIPSKANYGLNIINGWEEYNRTYEQSVCSIRFYPSGYLLDTCDGQDCVIEKLFNESWFLTKEEADKALETIKTEYSKGE